MKDARHYMVLRCRDLAVGEWMDANHQIQCAREVGHFLPHVFVEPDPPRCSRSPAVAHLLHDLTALVSAPVPVNGPVQCVRDVGHRGPCLWS